MKFEGFEDLLSDFFVGGVSGESLIREAKLASDFVLVHSFSLRGKNWVYWNGDKLDRIGKKSGEKLQNLHFFSQNTQNHEISISKPLPIRTNRLYLFRHFSLTRFELLFPDFR